MLQDRDVTAARSSSRPTDPIDDFNPFEKDQFAAVGVVFCTKLKLQISYQLSYVLFFIVCYCVDE
jgi:hypothetical protein